MSHDFDLIILGSGPAGFSCSMQATKFDKKVLIIEANENHLGGSWINSGTVPSKALREAASSIHKYSQQFGEVNNTKPYLLFQMADLLKIKDKVLQHENSEIKRNLIKNEVKTVRGFGRIVGPNTVEVSDGLGTKKVYTADKILISTGSAPRPPKSFKIDHKTILDAQSILSLEHIPRRLVIVGAGVQAIEYATIFASMGTKITILNPESSYFGYLDHEIKEILDESLKQFRITVYNSIAIDKVGKNQLRNCTEIHFRDDTEVNRVIETEHVLHFAGRIPNSSNIGAETIGIELDEQGYILTDSTFKTNVASIYAAGDVIGYPQSASASFSQGRTAACHMFDIPIGEMSSTLPFSVYSIPEFSTVGLTETEAIEAGHSVTVGRAYYDNLTKATVSNNSTGMLKLVFETDTFKLLGVHAIGAAACEIIHIGQAVIAFNGDIRYFISNMMNYPTYAEAYRIAAFNGVNRVYKAGVKYRTILK
jgi:NAD(P) transhydrogenase